MVNIFQAKRSAQKPEKRFWLRFFFVFVFSLQPLVFSLSADAAKIYPTAGSTSAAFLKIGAGARAVGMAGAFTALADDPYAVYWNPAGLVYLREKNLAFTHNDYFQDLNQEFLVYTVPGSDMKFLKSRPLTAGVWGFGLNYFYTPKDLERRSGLNEDDPLAPISPVEGKFKAYDMALSASYGFNYKENLDLGATLKYVRQVIDVESANSAALDLGALYGFDWGGENLKAGFTVQNIGPGLKFIDKRFALPLIFKAGLSRRAYGSGLLLSFDVSKPIDNYPFLALGFEYPLSNKLYLRSGYRYRVNGNELGPWSGVSAGAGFALNNFSFDYAFSPFGDLGNTHRFSVAFKFAKPGKAVMPTARESVPAAEAVSGTLAAYEVKAKALTISSRGTRYEISAASADSPLYSLKFKSLMRSRAPANLTAIEGDLPGSLLKKMPAGTKLFKAWQFGPGVGNVQGEIEFGFKVPKTGGEKGDYSFFYLTQGGWKRVTPEPVSEDAAYSYFSASAPFSTHYAIGNK